MNETPQTAPRKKVVAHDWLVNTLGRFDFSDGATPQRVFEFASLFADEQPFVPAPDRGRVIGAWTDIQTKLADSTQSIASDASALIDQITASIQTQKAFDNGSGQTDLAADIGTAMLGTATAAGASEVADQT